MNLLVFVNEHKPAAIDLVKSLASGWDAAGIAWAVGGTGADAIAVAPPLTYDGSQEGWTGVVLGGDGTLLTAARAAPGIPLLAVNFGTVGFLSTVEPAEAEKAVADLVAGRARFEERSMLQVTVDGGEPALAVNEAVVGRHHSRRTVELAVEVDGELFWRWACDGVLVSTPTGSTAYALSAGGPLVAPEADVLTVVPVCAHTLLDKALVLSSASVVRIVPAPGTGEDVAVTADGSLLATGPVGEVSVRAADRPLVLVAAPGGRYERLRHKLTAWSTLGERP